MSGIDILGIRAGLRLILCLYLLSQNLFRRLSVYDFPPKNRFESRGAKNNFLWVEFRQKWLKHKKSVNLISIITAVISLTNQKDSPCPFDIFAINQISDYPSIQAKAFGNVIGIRFRAAGNLGTVFKFTKVFFVGKLNWVFSSVICGTILHIEKHKPSQFA